MGLSERAKRKSAFRSRCVRRSSVLQRTAPREREAVMHFSSDPSSEAASELHSSRLVRPIRSRKRFRDLNGLAGFGQAVPSKRSSPPAEKWAVCIGGWGRSQGARGRYIAVFLVFAARRRAPHGGTPLHAASDQAQSPIALWPPTPPASTAAPPRAAASWSTRPCCAPTPAAGRPRRPVPPAAPRSDRSCARSTSGGRWR
jgi:hypothetical protein